MISNQTSKNGIQIYPKISQDILPIFILPVQQTCHSRWDRSYHVYPSRLPFWQQACPSLASWNHFCPGLAPAPTGAVAV